MPTTTTWNIDYPDGSSAITPLESHFEALADSTEAALTSLKANVRGANSTATIGSLATGLNDTNTRLALNLQHDAAAPTGEPINGGVEGSMHWDSANDKLYIYTTDLGWKLIWEKTINATAPTITVASGWDTLTDVNYKERNGIVNLSFSVKRNGSQIDSGNITNTLVATIATGYRPAGVVSWSTGPSGWAQGYVNATGQVYITASGSNIADNSDFDVAVSYIKE